MSGGDVVSVRLAERPASRLEPIRRPPAMSGCRIGSTRCRCCASIWRISAIFALAVMLTVTAVTHADHGPPTKPRRAWKSIRRAKCSPWKAAPRRSSDAEYLETEAQVLQTDDLAVEVIRSLHLDQNPELVGNGKPKGIAMLPPRLPRSIAAIHHTGKIALAQFPFRLKVRRDTASRLIHGRLLQPRSRSWPHWSPTPWCRPSFEDTFQTRHNAIMKSSEWLSKQLDDIRSKMETPAAPWPNSRGPSEFRTWKATRAPTPSIWANSAGSTPGRSRRGSRCSPCSRTENGNPDSLPEVRNSPVVQQLSQKLAEQRAELSQTLVVYGKNHPTAKKLQSQVDELQSQLNGQKRPSSIRYEGQLCRSRSAGAADGSGDERHHQRNRTDGRNTPRSRKKFRLK